VQLIRSEPPKKKEEKLSRNMYATQEYFKEPQKCSTINDKSEKLRKRTIKR
jgi:hypothetical protein